jgi:hypothetical protein
VFIPAPAILASPSRDRVSHHVHHFVITSWLLAPFPFTSTIRSTLAFKLCRAIYRPIVNPGFLSLRAFYPIKSRVSHTLLKPPKWYRTWRKNCGRRLIFLWLIDFEFEEHASDRCTCCYENTVTFDSVHHSYLLALLDAVVKDDLLDPESVWNKCP